ncbi:RES domain-containing protein [uncultured Tateyamaria sp.]|uniref:RES family NAD+ phosphorylase n=1 Tax=uncultured Tateyamaria sp. TaxID=455651 RepID=UPI00262EEF6C|nr:RES domain-containing protein [uncultured Tateyamaria sp.]
MPLTDGRYRGLLYRALNPVYARMPLSGAGAERYGGRFNPVGVAALYTALDPTTALREANQVGDLQPTVLVAYRADIGPLFDTRDPDALKQMGVTPRDLADPAWRAQMLDQGAVPTQDLAAACIAAGFSGLLVRSFARGTDAGNLNLVLWEWKGLAVVDDDQRLDRM